MAHGHISCAAGGVTRSIMCCDALALSDVLATGSNDGYLRTKENQESNHWMRCRRRARATHGTLG
jgi:hypothetical protein